MSMQSFFTLDSFIYTLCLDWISGFFGSAPGIEVVRQKGLQLPKDHLLTSDSLNEYIMHENSKDIISNQVTQVETIESETVNEEKNIEAEPDNQELVNKEILESPPEEIQPDPASMLLEWLAE